MLHADIRIFRKSIDSYIYLTEGKLNINPFGNVVFIFCNKFQNKIKILHHETGSLKVILQKNRTIYYQMAKNHKIIISQINQEFWS